MVFDLKKKFDLKHIEKNIVDIFFFCNIIRIYIVNSKFVYLALNKIKMVYYNFKTIEHDRFSSIR